MITTGMKAEFNLKRPKYGLKGYYMPEPNLHEANYKIDAFAINRRDKQDHEIDNEVKKHSWVPSAKYDVLTDWSKPEKFATSTGRVRGRFLKGKKMTMTEDILFE